MASKLRLALFIALATLGCQVRVPDAGKSPARATTAPKASATPAAPARVLASAPDTIALQGVVSVDAGYATAHGAVPLGSVLGVDGAISHDGSSAISHDGSSAISHDGSSAISHDGSSAISHDGSSAISHDGSSLINSHGQIVAQGGGNVIVPASLITNDGGSLISQDGASLITNDGGSLISQDGAGAISHDGSSAISHDGSSAISHDGSSYRLAAADAGLALPAAGMWVSVVDMTTGLALPLGQDEDKKPVYAIYSDAAGKFKVYVPKAVAANVRVVARAPGGEPGLSLNVIARSTGEGERQVDGPRAVATSYVRTVAATRLLHLIDQGPEVVAGYFTGDTSAGVAAALRDSFLAPLGQLKRAFGTVGANNLSPLRRFELVLLATDAALADMDLDAVKTDMLIFKPEEPASAAFATESAMGAVVETLKMLETAAADSTRGKDLTAYFAAKPYLVAANSLEPCARFRIRKASDLGDFLVRNYLTSTSLRDLDLVDHLLHDQGLDPVMRDRLRGAGAGLFGAIAARIAEAEPGKPPVVEAMVRQILAAGPKLAAAPSPAPVAAAPCVPGASPPQAGAYTVATLAGNGTPGSADGVGAAARFNHPYALAADATTLYVADLDNNAIRRVASGAVTTVKTDAPLLQPRGLALAEDGSLYVADAGHHTIRRLVIGADGQAKVTTIAGDGSAGFADGPGLQAKFDLPGALAVDKSGHLVVADEEDHRLRLIDLANPDHPVQTLLGDGTPGTRDDDHARLARCKRPQGLAFAPDGTLYFTSGALALRGIRAPIGPDAPTFYLAGRGDSVGTLDGFWGNAFIAAARGLAVDAAGRIYLADANNDRIRAITPDGWVATIAGSGKLGQSTGFQDGPAAQATLAHPEAVAIGPDGSLYVADEANNAIRKLTPVR